MTTLKTHLYIGLVCVTNCIVHRQIKPISKVGLSIKNTHDVVNVTERLASIWEATSTQVEMFGANESSKQQGKTEKQTKGYDTELYHSLVLILTPTLKWEKEKPY